MIKEFSIENGRIIINHKNEYFSLVDENNHIIASTECYATSIQELPFTLIRKPKTDEELANEMYPYSPFQMGLYYKSGKPIIGDYNLGSRHNWILGRKSVDVKRDILDFATWYSGMDRSKVESAYNRYLKEVVVKPIYPKKITVEYEDGKYYWETLKATY